MVSCCPEVVSGASPPWWPSSVPFKIPLVASSTDPQRWVNSLKEIVCRCYEYHNCQHVLRFCSRLANLPHSTLKFKENGQGFISIYNKTNNKLIVTFKKRNQVYDRQSASPFKTLLPRKPSQPPRDQHIEDIYLCNYCDEEFTSGKVAVAHESTCKGKREDDSPHNATSNQEVLMRYFGLCRSNSSPKKPGTPSTKRFTSVRLTPRSYMQIPISSPLGRNMAANVQHLSTEEKVGNLAKIEANCKGKVSHVSQTRLPRRFGATRFSKRKKIDAWTHSYCFNKAQREDKRLTLKTGLNKRSRLLLQKCKRAIVLVEKLPLLDPLALHAAASLHFHAEKLRSDPGRSVAESNETTESRIPSPQDLPAKPKPVTVFIDLTCDEGSDHDDLSHKENFCYNRNSPDIFLNSSSNHKRPPLQDWTPIPPLKQFMVS